MERRSFLQILGALLAAPLAALFPRRKAVAHFDYVISDFGAPGDPSPLVGGGAAESLEDLIYNLSPTDTPFMTLIREHKTEEVFHAWYHEPLKPAVPDSFWTDLGWDKG